MIVDLGQPRFNGTVTAEWLDAKGDKLSSANYLLNEPRFRLGDAGVIGRQGSRGAYLRCIAHDGT